MSDADKVQYETRIVKCVRGLEARTVAKWQSDGWEIVSQSTGRMQTEITIRRPKPKTQWWLFAALGGLIVVLIVGALVASRLSGTSNGTPQAGATPSSSMSQAAQPTPSGSAGESSPAGPTASDTAEAVITVQNNPEFKALLQVGDYCAKSVERFAEKYAGKTISFDANIAAMNTHGDYETRYDILIGAGNFSKTQSRGPSFQFRDVAPTSDLNFTGKVPDTIGVGTNLRVTAEVGEYETPTCLLLLEPVETTVR